MATKIKEKTGIPGSPCNKGERTRAMRGPVAGSKAGVIVYWTGTASNIPTGWALCNGSSNSAGSGLNLTTGHPFCKMTSTGAGTYVTAQPTGLSEPHPHGGSIGAEEPPIVVTVDLKKTNITETKLDGEHKHPHGLDPKSGTHSHGGGYHAHKFNTDEADEVVGNAVGATHDHDGTTSGDTSLSHTAAEVTASLGDHLGIDTGHNHLLPTGSGTVASGNDVGANAVETTGYQSYGNLNAASTGHPGGELLEHVASTGELTHAHTHPLTLSVSVFPDSVDILDTDVHTHETKPHSHEVDLTSTNHSHPYSGDHPHDYEMPLTNKHKHPVTDKEHKHPDGSIDTHTHSIVAISPDDGHTHEVNVSGIMLMPIENLSDTAVPGSSGLGRRTPYTCSDSEDRRNFSRQADAVDGLPAGIILMWSRPTSTIPNGWGIADSYGNSTGSGLNVVNWLIVHTGTNSEVGVSWRIGGAREGGHDHTVALENKTVSTDLENAYTEIDTVTGAGSHYHSGSLYGGSHQHHGGWHEHPVNVSPEQIDTNSTGGHIHTHDADEDDQVVVTAHTSVQVVAMVADHPDHTHSINVEENAATHNPVGVDINLVRTGGANPGTVLEHNAADGISLVHHVAGHDHDATVVVNGLHTHKSSPHSHPSSVSGIGYHTHYGGSHKHVFTTERVTDHTHTITDTGHTHPIEIDVHTHVAVATDGSHTHEEAKPKRCYLIPIEKLP